MGVEASVEERTTDDGDLCLTLDLRIPQTLESVDVGGETVERGETIEAGEAIEHREAFEAKCEQLREQRDALQAEVDELQDELEAARSRLRASGEGSVEGGEERPHEGTSGAKTAGGEPPDGRTAPSGRDLTEGERETLQALQAMGGSRTSTEIADEVDATLQSVRSWLPKLVKAGYVRTEPDPTDGRRKLYAAVNPDESAAEDESGDDSETVYIASAGGSPSQVFHVRKDCPQLQKSTDCVEKDRSVVPHHRPCGNCVPEGLEEGLVAVAKGSSTTTYHKREDCPKLGSANNVVIQARETVPNHTPCDDCVPIGSEQSSDEDDEASRELAGNDTNGRDEARASEEKTKSNEEKTDSSEEKTDSSDVNGEASEEKAETSEEKAETSEVDEPDGTDDVASSGEHVPGEGEDPVRDDAPSVATICRQNDLDRQAILDALETATAIYHVQRELTLTSDETEALLRGLGLFEDLHGGGRVPPNRTEPAVRKHVPSSLQVESGDGTRD